MSDITVRFEQVPDAVATMHWLEMLGRQLIGRDCRARVVDDSGLVVVAPTRTRQDGFVDQEATNTINVDYRSVDWRKIAIAMMDASDMPESMRANWIIGRG